MEVENLAIEALKLHPKNARKHNAKNLDVIKNSLSKFGQQKPIVVDKDNVVLAGNGTLMAAKELGWTTIFVNRADLSYKDGQAFALVDNRANELSEWDDDILRETLRYLNDEEYPTVDIGFDLRDFGILDVAVDKPISENKELFAEDFNNFQYQCPRCGFEFTDGKNSESSEDGAMES